MEKSELKSLDVNVINFILQNNKATIENLCNCFDVSQVNIRNVLAKIEIFIKKNNIGVLLKENNEYFFENNSLNLNFDYTKLQTKNIEKSERIAYILLKLFFHKTINLTRISQELDISRITLNGDLEHIKSFLKEFNLDLVSIQWRGIFLQGDPFMIEKVSVLFIAKLYLEGYFHSNLKKVVNPLVIEFFRNSIDEESENKITELANKLYIHFDIQLGIVYYFFLKSILIFNLYKIKHNIEFPLLKIKQNPEVNEKIYKILSEEEKEMIGDNITLLNYYISNCINKEYISIFSFDMENILKDIFTTFNLKKSNELTKNLVIFINYIYFNTKFLIPSYYNFGKEEGENLEKDISISIIEIFNRHNIPFKKENIIFLYFYLKDLISESQKQNVLIIDIGSLNYHGKKLKEKLKYLENINTVDIVSYFNFKVYSNKFGDEDKYETYIFIDLPFEKTNNYPNKNCIFISSYDLMSNTLDITNLL